MDPQYLVHDSGPPGSSLLTGFADTWNAALVRCRTQWKRQRHVTCGCCQLWNALWKMRHWSNATCNPISYFPGHCERHTLECWQIMVTACHVILPERCFRCTVSCTCKTLWSCNAFCMVCSMHICKEEDYSTCAAALWIRHTCVLIITIYYLIYFNIF